MSDEVTIRLARRGDLPALGRLGATLMRVHHAFDPDRFMAPGDHPEDGYAWFLGAQLSEPDVVIFVAEQTSQENRPGEPGELGGPGEVVGYVYAGLEPLSWKELRGPAGFIHDVVVDPRARRAGVATRLMERASGWLEGRGAPRVMLWTADKNTEARQLFERLGFRSTMVEMTRERRENNS